MGNVKTISSEKKLKEVFNTLSEIFYDDALEFGEHYYTMSERYEEMKDQFKKDKNLLLYIEDDGKIVAGLTSKGMDIEKNKITLGVIAVSKNNRRKGYAKQLIQEFEKRCKKKGIKHIDLGSRLRACPLYLKLNYQPSLMIQVFDFATVEDVKKANIFNLKSGFEWQGETYGFIFFQVDQVKSEYITHFEDNVKTAHAQYIFEKDI